MESYKSLETLLKIIETKDIIREIFWDSGDVAFDYIVKQHSDVNIKPAKDDWSDEFGLPRLEKSKILYAWLLYFNAMPQVIDLIRTQSDDYLVSFTKIKNNIKYNDQLIHQLRTSLELLGEDRLKFLNDPEKTPFDVWKWYINILEKAILEYKKEEGKFPKQFGNLIEYGMDLTQEQIEKKHNSLDKMLWFRNFYASLCLETDDSFFKNSTPLFVTKEISDSLMTALPTLPNTSLSEDDIPKGTGWVCFENLDYTITDLYCNDGNHATKIFGVSWKVWNDFVRLVWFGTSHHFETPIPIGSSTIELNKEWDFVKEYQKKHGKPFVPNPEHNTSLQFVDEIISNGFFLSLFSFIKQPLVITSQGKAPRNARRRLAKEMPELEPLFNIIHLRKSVYDSSYSQPSGRSKVHDFRWIVNGHWRNQYYSSINKHKPIWISAFIKGTDGKPLKQKGVNIYRIER